MTWPTVSVAATRGVGRLVGTFLAGLFVVLPLLLTIAIVAWAGAILYALLGPDSAVGKLLISLGLSFSTTTYVAYVVGVAMAALAVYAVGLVVQSRLSHALAVATDAVMYRIPLVSTVYDITKRFTALVDRRDGDALKGMRPVWCTFGGEGGAAVLALLPTPETTLIGTKRYCAVLVPSAPVPVGGCLIYVPEEWVQPADIGLEALMNVYVSMGVSSAKVLNQ